MRPLALHAPVARDLFFASFAAYTVAELVLQARTRSGGARDPSYIAMWSGSLLGIGLAFALAGPGPRLPGPGWLPVAVGLTVLWLGFVLRYWSVRTLGRFFTVRVGVAGDQRVVDTGPYAVVRHPSYTGMIGCIAGMGIALDSWSSVAAALVFPTAAVLIRIRHEERTLNEELGDQYAAYSARTRRLVPGVW